MIGQDGSAPNVEEGQGKPLLRRPSLKKGPSGRISSEPKLLYCKRVESRVQARNHLGRLLSANEPAVQSTAVDELANGSTSTREAKGQWPQSTVIVLECTEDSVPWSTAVGSAAACLKIVRCRRGFLTHEALAAISTMLASGSAYLIVISGTPKCQHLRSSVIDWQSNDMQNWRLPPPPPPALRTLSPGLPARDQVGKGFWTTVFSCVGSGQQADGFSEPITGGQVAPVLASTETSEVSNTTDQSAAGCQEDSQEAAQDAYVPAIEAVAAELYLGPHKRSLTMQLDEWDEKPANGQSTLVRQISADAFCVNHMRDRRRKDTLQADEATLAKILHKHCVLLSQLLLKKLSKRLEEAVISNVEVVPMAYNPQSHQLTVIRRSWYSGRCYFHE